MRVYLSEADENDVPIPGATLYYVTGSECSHGMVSVSHYHSGEHNSEYTNIDFTKEEAERIVAKVLAYTNTEPLPNEDEPRNYVVVAGPEIQESLTRLRKI